MKRLANILLIAATSLLSVILIAETTAGVHVQNKQCQRLYSEWKKKPGHKAFAVSQAMGVAMQGCGSVWNAQSKAVAEREAVKTCKEAKVMAATCAVMESK